MRKKKLQKEHFISNFTTVGRFVKENYKFPNVAPIILQTCSLRLTCAFRRAKKGSSSLETDRGERPDKGEKSQSNDQLKQGGKNGTLHSKKTGGKG